MMMVASVRSSFEKVTQQQEGTEHFFAVWRGFTTVEAGMEFTGFVSLPEALDRALKAVTPCVSLGSYQRTGRVRDLDQLVFQPVLDTKGAGPG